MRLNERRCSYIDVGYIDQVVGILQKLKKTETEHLQTCAQMIFDTVQAGHCVFFYGCTHAGILTQESYYRTGGLSIINPIFAPGTLVNEQPITITSAIERLSGYGRIIVEQNNISEGDLLFIHSVSGRNSVPIDMAIEAKARKATVVGITSLDYTTHVKSRHQSGECLYNFCDLVLDNQCPYGDSLVRLDHSEVFVGPGSTAIGIVILNEIVVRTARLFDEAGMVPPVFTSANVDDGEEKNIEIYKLYRKNIRYKMC